MHTVPLEYYNSGIVLMHKKKTVHALLWTHRISLNGLRNKFRHKTLIKTDTAISIIVSFITLEMWICGFLIILEKIHLILKTQIHLICGLGERWDAIFTDIKYKIWVGDILLEEKYINPWIFQGFLLKIWSDLQLRENIREMILMSSLNTPCARWKNKVNLQANDLSKS